MKLLAAVPSCEAHKDRHKVIMDTWGKDAEDSGIEVEFFTGHMLAVPDDYANLWKKTQAICRWAVFGGYDYIARIDTDTYVHVPRLLASGFENYDYSGYVRPDFLPKYAY